MEENRDISCYSKSNKIKNEGTKPDFWKNREIIFTHTNETTIWTLVIMLTKFRYTWHVKFVKGSICDHTKTVQINMLALGNKESSSDVWASFPLHSSLCYVLHFTIFIHIFHISIFLKFFFIRTRFFVHLIFWSQQFFHSVNSKIIQ